MVTTRNAVSSARPKASRAVQGSSSYEPSTLGNDQPRIRTHRLLGADRLAGILLPEDIQLLRTQLIATRAPSTANHYLATFAGFLAWCETNGYCRKGLSTACIRFAMTGREPDPLTKAEFDQMLSKGCLHVQDHAAVTLAVYTGLRPGEMCGLAVEDVDLTAGST